MDSSNRSAAAEYLQVPAGGFKWKPFHIVNDNGGKSSNFDEAHPEQKCKKGTVVLVPFNSYFLNSSSDRIDRYLSILVICR